MKKLLSAAVAAVMLVGSAFAIDLCVDANFALPVSYSVEKSQTTFLGNTIAVITTIEEGGFGGDIGFSAMLTNSIGVKAELGLYSPHNATVTLKSIIGDNKTDFDPVEINYSDVYDSYTSFNLFVGPTLGLNAHGAITAYLTPGLNIDFRKAVAKGSDTVALNQKLIGIGAELDGRLNLSKFLYINAACPVIYNFKVIDSNNKEYKASGLYVVPKIGVGVRF